MIPSIRLHAYSPLLVQTSDVLRSVCSLKRWPESRSIVVFAVCCVFGPVLDVLATAGRRHTGHRLPGTRQDRTSTGAGVAGASLGFFDVTPQEPTILASALQATGARWSAQHAEAVSKLQSHVLQAARPWLPQATALRHRLEVLARNLDSCEGTSRSSAISP